MRTELLIIAFALSVVLAGSSTSASASASSASSSSSSKPRENDRDLKIDFKSTQLQVESKSKDANSKTKLNFDVQNEDALKIRMRYQSEDAQGASVQNSLRVRLISLVEFDPTTLDAAANGAYSGGASVKTTSFKSLNGVMSQLADTTIDTATIKNFQWKGGPVTVTMHLTGVPVSRGSETPLTPGALKFDFDVAGYTFAKSTNRLALLAMVDSSNETKRKDKSSESQKGEGSNEGEISTGSSFFSFANTATCANGPEIKVATSSLAKPSTSEDSDNSKDAGEGTQKVFFTFLADAPANICWDPKVGQDILDTTAASSSSVISASLALLVAAVAALFAF